MKRLSYPFLILKELKGSLENKKGLNEEEFKTDEEIFTEAMAEVREIKEFRKIPYKSPPRIKPRLLQEDDMRILREIIEKKIKIDISATGEYIEWHNPALRKDLAERLHRGDFSVQDYIDLHGTTLNEAEEAFGLFFKNAIKKGLFCVKVIHGRGLKSPKGP
ncbi:MAG: Smr/MutS family protein, partial [Nitrospirota bacterium]